MAGIGFKLQKLFQEDYFSSRFKAYLYAGLVTSGPWLIVILTITLIRLISGSLLTVPLEQRDLFNLSVSYVFIFSQVILGIQQLVVTRYLADQLYADKKENLFPAFLGMTKITMSLALLSSILFLVFADLPLSYKWVLVLLFLIINGIWNMFLFLSAAKYYQAVAYSFLLGSVSSIGAIYGIVYAIPWLNSVGLQFMESFYLLVGFTFGMLVTFFGLTYAMFTTYSEQYTTNSYSYFSYFDRYPALFWTGFLYNLGIWVSNWVIWFGPGHEILATVFRYHPLYDPTIFWAYLTIVPTLILFVVSVETRFYERYRTFYGFINYGGTLEQIQTAKKTMNRVLVEEMQRLIRSQGTVTFLIVLLTPFLLSRFILNSDLEVIFRLAAIGAFANAMVLVLTLLLLYLEDQKGAMWTSIIFFGVNFAATLILMPLGKDWFGLGFAIGSTLAFLFSGLRLIYFMSRVDYFAFGMPDQDYLVPRRKFFTRLGMRLNGQTK